MITRKKMEHLKNFKIENFEYDKNDLFSMVSGLTSPKSTMGNPNMKFVFENSNIYRNSISPGKIRNYECQFKIPV